MSSLAILLVHGFSGQVSDLSVLADCLEEWFGAGSTEQFTLPGHTEGRLPDSFDPVLLRDAIGHRLLDLRQRVKTLVVFGHSTGGNLLLDALRSTDVSVDLLLLGASPFRIDLNYLERWKHHHAGKDQLSLSVVSGLVKMINSVAEGAPPDCPSVILQGKADDLVPESEAVLWKQYLGQRAAFYSFAELGHHLFSERSSAVAAIILQISRCCQDHGLIDRFVTTLAAAEPEILDFAAVDRQQVWNLVESPSGRRLLKEKIYLPDWVAWDPVIANIEVTTKCNFRCRHCARTQKGVTARDMSTDQFESILEKTPSAYRVTLVGLGEPLLHPQLVELVATAKRHGRRVALVTNGQLLTPEMSSRLLDAGLDGITFSLDSVDSGQVNKLRAGSDLALIEQHIREFCRLAQRLDRAVARAVFCAVSVASYSGLSELIDRVKVFGVHVLMLSDLNFKANQHQSLAAGIDAEMESTLRNLIRRAYAQGLPVLGVRRLEDFGLAQHYADALLLPVDQLYRRAKKHRHCFSLWQTVSINVDGDICLCDCRPEDRLGNIFEQELSTIWNGSAMLDQRRRLLSDEPAEECQICPRM